MLILKLFQVDLIMLSLRKIKYTQIRHLGLSKPIAGSPSNTGLPHESLPTDKLEKIHFKNYARASSFINQILPHQQKSPVSISGESNSNEIFFMQISKYSVSSLFELQIQNLYLLQIFNIYILHPSKISQQTPRGFCQLFKEV